MISKTATACPLDRITRITPTLRGAATALDVPSTAYRTPSSGSRSNCARDGSGARHVDSDDALEESDRQFLAPLKAQKASRCKGLQFLPLAAFTIAAHRWLLPS